MVAWRLKCGISTQNSVLFLMEQRKTLVSEIAPGVHQIVTGEGAHVGVYAPNVYLVVGSERAVFIDSAYGEPDEVDAHLICWRAQGEPHIAALILTHRHGDHIGGAVALRDATGGAITCNEHERTAIDADLSDDASVDAVVSDGDTLELGGTTLEFVHTPGHTLGSLCIIHRQAGVLFSGDMILGTGTTVISPEHGDMAAYIASMRKLMHYYAKLIAPGHGPIIDTPQAKLDELVQHRIAREEQIAALIAAGNRNLDALLHAIYAGNIHPALMDTARSQIRAHIIKLEHEGRVRTTPDGEYERV